MSGVGEGIAFATLVVAAAWLEINGKNAGGLWALCAAWVIFSNWGQSKGQDDE